MNPRLLAFAGLFALAVVPAVAAESSPLERTKQARANIDVLLGPRRNPVPPPANPANPFAAPGAVVTTPDPGTNNPPTNSTSSEQATLARALKISGTAELGGRQQLIVNGLAYKEGDVIGVRDGDQVVRVRLVRIAPPSAVFELNGNEVILRIKN